MRFSSFLATVLALSLSGCSGDKNKGTTDKGKETSDTTKQTSDTTKHSTNKGNEALDRPTRENHMKIVGLAIHFYFNANKDNGPTRFEDIKPLTGFEDVNKRLESGDIVVVYGVGVKDIQATPEGFPKTVMGYEKDVPTKGGIILYADGSVANVTAEEFGKLKLAKKK